MESIRWTTTWPNVRSDLLRCREKLCNTTQVKRVRKWSSLSERNEDSEACWPIGMAVPRGLLRGYGDRREEASFASESVDHIKNTKKLTKIYGKWLKIGLATASPKSDH